MRMIAVLLFLMALATSAHADVFVLGNTETGQIVIRGNTSDSAAEAAREAKGIRQTGWVQLFGDDVRGWGAIACVKSAKGVQFSLASGHGSELEAVKLAQAGGQNMQKESGGTLMFLCAPRWNNQGQPLAFGSDGMSAGPAAVKETGLIDKAVAVTKGTIHKSVTKDYRRDCVPPPEAARAELAPTASGVKQVKDRRSPVQSWKPASWCPPSNVRTSTGIRN